MVDPSDPGFFGGEPVVSATPDDFERQMRYVAGRFPVIGLDDLLAFLHGRRPLPPRAVMVTFDDGYADNHAHALPVLRALGLPAVCFLITAAIGTDAVPWWDELAMLAPGDGDGPPDDRAQALKRMPDDERAKAVAELRRTRVPPTAPSAPLFMTWDQARELEAAGVSCQPHTHNHPILTRISADRMRDELARSKATVEERMGRSAVAFAYPNGGRDDYDGAVLGALDAAGYEVAFTTLPGPVRPADARARRYEIPRVSMAWTDGFDAFRLKVHGILPGAARARSALAHVGARLRTGAAGTAGRAGPTGEGA